MVETVERLRQAERVLRQHRQLQRPHRLIDHFVQPGRLEQLLPARQERREVVARLAERALAGYVEATRHDDAEKNRLCPPSRFGNSLVQWADMNVRGTRASMALGAEPDIAAWANTVAVNPARIPPAYAASEELGRVRLSAGHELKVRARASSDGSSDQPTITVPSAETP